MILCSYSEYWLCSTGDPDGGHAGVWQDVLGEAARVGAARAALLRAVHGHALRPHEGTYSTGYTHHTTLHTHIAYTFLFVFISKEKTVITFFIASFAVPVILLKRNCMYVFLNVYVKTLPPESVLSANGCGKVFALKSKKYVVSRTYCVYNNFKPGFCSRW